MEQSSHRPKVECKYESQTSRVLELSAKGKILSTPTYFPSVSSCGTKFSFGDMVSFLIDYSYPRFLVSAYDIVHTKPVMKKKLLGGMKSFCKNGFLFLDSGGYESFFKEDHNWRFNSYKSLLGQIECDFYTSFDFPLFQRGREPWNQYTQLLSSQEVPERGLFVPIVHETKPDLLVKSLTKFVRGHADLCRIIAISELECGDSILEKARTLLKVRKILNENDNQTILHLLGCGNPLSMLAFSYCGVDSFDSLDWTNHVMSRNTLAVYDICQLDLLGCDCKICAGSNEDYLKRALLHNLLFLQDFMVDLQSAIKNSSILRLMTEHFGGKFVKKIAKTA